MVAKLGGGQRLEPGDQPRLDALVEEGQIRGAVLQGVADQVAQELLGEGAVGGEVGESHLRLDHPELGGVATGVGVLGAEGRAEGVDVGKGGGEELPLELAGDGQPGLLAEEVGARSRRPPSFSGGL